MKNDPLYYLAVDLLDIAARCHFTQTGIDATRALIAARYTVTLNETSPAPAEVVEPAPAPKVSSRKARKPTA